LEVVALLRGHADLLTLDGRLDALGPLVAQELGDLLGVLLVDALLERADQTEALAGGHRLAQVEHFHAQSAADQLLDEHVLGGHHPVLGGGRELEDRKSTRLNSSHVSISYAVFCLKKKKQK